MATKAELEKMLAASRKTVESYREEWERLEKHLRVVSLRCDMATPLDELIDKVIQNDRWARDERCRLGDVIQARDMTIAGLQRNILELKAAAFDKIMQTPLEKPGE